MFRAIFLCALLSGPAWAEGEAEFGDPELGEQYYLGYCAVCHGPEGRGDGPMASVLNAVPADLTGLAAANGGTFPTFRVARQIDGRDPLLAHGGEMPLFGELFTGNDAVMTTDAGQPILTSQPIVDLVAWLMAVQH